MTDLDLMSDWQTLAMFTIGATLWAGLLIRHARRRYLARHRRTTYQHGTPRGVRVDISLGLKR